MSDLRAAAQQALEALETVFMPHHPAVIALKAVLEQTEQEVKGCDHCNHPLYAAIKCRVCGRVTEQEPVAWPEGYEPHELPADYTGKLWIEGQVRRLYETHPPRREWRGLTEEEIHDCFQQRHRDKAVERRMITRAIEAALKERNV